jgi:hypothetical protein
MLSVLRDAFLFSLFRGGDRTAWVFCTDADSNEEAVVGAVIGGIRVPISRSISRQISFSFSGGP